MLTKAAAQAQRAYFGHGRHKFGDDTVAAIWSVVVNKDDLAHTEAVAGRGGHRREKRSNLFDEIDDRCRAAIDGNHHTHGADTVELALVHHVTLARSITAAG